MGCGLEIFSHSGFRPSLPVPFQPCAPPAQSAWTPPDHDRCMGTLAARWACCILATDYRPVRLPGYTNRSLSHTRTHAFGHFCRIVVQRNRTTVCKI